ncbi:putative oxidoreductase YjmC [Crassostrea virginica]
MATEGDVVISKPELRDFVIRCVTAVGADPEHAVDLAELLITADYRGHYSHGLNRLEMYCSELRSGVCRGGAGTPEIVRQTVATALVEGHNLMGPVVGKFAVDLAIQKAKEAGIGMVTVRGSNHFGIAGWYALRAMEHGLIGMSFTNTSPILNPTRSKDQVLGTNPICMAAPGKDGDSFVLDMATSSVALGKVEIQERRKLPLPHGWAVDADGKETYDPEKVKGLLPLGGTEESSGYKGYGLSMMVDVLTGILSGALFGPHIRFWKGASRVANLGHCFIVFDPKAFTDDFEDRMSELMDYCRHLEPVEGSDKPVLVPGDKARKHMELCDKLGGIPYHPKQVDFMNDMAKMFNLTPIKTMS